MEQSLRAAGEPYDVVTYVADGPDSGIWTLACASLRPNLRGLFDMHGNVWEWCNSWYHADPLRSADPEFVGSARVLRGGSWGNSAVGLRSACRSTSRPASTELYTGFRVARALRRP